MPLDDQRLVIEPTFPKADKLMAMGLALVIWLLPEARWIGQVRFDIHTMFFGVLFTLLGMQILSIGLFAKIFSYTERFDHSNVGLSRWLRRLPLRLPWLRAR